MFFSNGLADSFLNLFATHPPLIERIQRLEPDFDRAFPQSQSACRSRNAAAQRFAAAQADLGRRR